MKIDYEIIKPYIEKKLINENIHPEDKNVRIFNYTQKCQFDKEWDDITKQCRGLIMNIKTGEILARPFPKFFNVAEHTDVYNLKVPDEEPHVYDKYDGSLGIMYTFKDKTRFATRGSFTSDQALWATAWWKEWKGDEPYGNDVTHLFEIIYPENRIVVDYDFSGVVHLCSIDTKTGEQVDSMMPVKKVEKIPYTDIEALKNLDTPNAEGFVLYYPKTNLRLKVKFDEYVRIHKIVTGLSVIGVWEYLKEHGVDADIRGIAESAPDEFYKWLEETANEIRSSFNNIADIVDKEFTEILLKLRYEKDRSVWAEEIKAMKYPAIGFAMLDHKDYYSLIWKIIRPTGNVTFKIHE